MEIVSSAHKHDVTDDDIRHAVANAIGAITRPDQPEFTMLIGPDATGQLLEIGVLATDDNDYVIHAMTARSKYLTLLNRRGDHP